jgi:hypothetical protein
METQTWRHGDTVRHRHMETERQRDWKVKRVGRQRGGEKEKYID